jgi:hypothetical protein
VKEMCPEGLKDDKGNVDWKQVKKNATELCPEELSRDVQLTGDLKKALRQAQELCPEEIKDDCEQVWKSVEDALPRDRSKKDT